VNVGAVTQGLRKFIRRHFTSRGDLPAPAFEAKVATEGAIRSTMRQVAYAQRDFARAARQAFGRQPSPEQLAQLDEVLKGERHITHAPEPLRPVLSRMRSQIDVLSQRLIDEGVIEEPLATTIRENLGTYATRSYRVFDDPAWAKKVPAEVRTKARALLRSEYPDLPEEELEGLFNTLLYRSESGPIAALAGSKLGSKDLSILTRRKDIAPEIRALWGEYHDPRLNYARSMAHMGQLVEQHKFLTTVRERGLGGFLFERPVVRGETSYHTRIAAEGSTTMEPLNGLYTSPEIADAFARAFKRDAPPPWLRAYYVVNGWAKFSKTVLSPVTHVRNLLGNTGFAVANGHWRAWKAGTAIRATIADMAGGEFNQFRDYAQKLTRLGVLDEGVHLGELRAVIQDAAVRSPDDPNMLGPVRLVRRVGQGAQALYRAEDGVWKIYAYENELARYRSALPNVPADELERRVATIVRNTYPTYSLVPSAVQAFRRFPLLGPFVSFPSEVVRTLSNTIRLTLAELRDPALRSIGAQRLAGLFAAALAVPAAARASRELVGITADAANDLREFLPPWSRVSELFFLSRDEHGNPQFIDLGYSDPYAYLRKPLRALLSGEDWQESLADAAGEALRPFFGEELLSGRLLDVARNQTVDGRRVYNPEADRLRQATDATAHVAAVLTPGAVDSFRRILKGVRGEVGPTGRVYEPDVEIGALVSGQRVSTLDLRQALGFKARDFSKQLADANRLFSSVLLRRGTVSDAELRDAYRQADRARFRVTRTLWRQIRAAERLGVPEQEIEAQLEAAGIPRRQILTLRDGIYERYRPSGWTKRLERESPDIEDRVWLWEGWAREERERPLEPQETQRPPVVGAGARP
jgi:hypothetical protein